MKKEKKSTLLPLAAALALALMSVAGNCPGTNATTHFVSSNSTSAVSVQSWHTAVIIDQEELDGNSFPTNIVLPLTTVSSYPMSVFAESAANFFVMFSRETSTSDVGMYGTLPVSFTADSWATSLSAYTQLDSAITEPDAFRPITAVDSLGDSMTAYAEDDQTGTVTVMKAAQRLASDGSWQTPVDLRASVEVADSTNVDASSVAIAVDAYNDTVAVWCSSDNHLYFNEYRFSVGWRFSNSSTADASWEDASSCEDEGVDIAFDGYSNGYGAYVDTSNNLNVRRWQGDEAASWLSTGPVAITNGASACFPKLFLTPSGASYLFFYGNCAAPAGDLMLASAPATSQSDPGADGFGAAAQFDITGGAGSSYIQDNGDPIPPMLSYNGSNAAVGFIKEDSSGAERLWVSIYNNGSWGGLTAVDLDEGDVTGGAVAINSGGTVAVAYSANVGGTEQMFVNYYKSGTWAGAQELSLPAILAPGVGATARYHPSVAIDSSGNAVVTFSMNDQLVALRRSVEASYR